MQSTAAPRRRALSGREHPQRACRRAQQVSEISALGSPLEGARPWDVVSGVEGEGLEPRQLDAQLHRARFVTTVYV